MSRRIATILLTTLLCVGTTAQTAPAGRDIRAVWLTTLSGLDWPQTYARSETTIRQQQQELTAMLDTLQKAGINTVLLQTRIRGTVIYPSKTEPWDACMSGTAGRSPGYDPLRFAIDECHKRGMELHAWVVTIPAGPWNSAGCQHLRKRYPKLLRHIGQDGYLDPSQPQTGDLLAAICREIAANYDVDGIHLDYIRYPETWKGVNTRQGQANITSIVRKIYRAVKDTRPTASVSCSPVGKYSDLSRYSSRGWNARDRCCQDAQAWLREGIMDQLYPMMYFNGDQFYPFALDWTEHSYGKDIVAGLGIYFLDRRHGNWHIDEVKRQIYFAQSIGMGICFFRAKFLVDDTQGIYEFLRYEYDYAKDIANAGSEDDTATDEETQSTHNSNGNGWTFDFSLDEVAATVDADYLLVETLQGQVVDIMPFNDTSRLNKLDRGIYLIRSLGRKGRAHRLGFVHIGNVYGAF